jgi:hypothetical protein
VARLAGDERAAAAARLSELAPAPVGVLPGAVDAAALETWWSVVRGSW